MVNLNNLKVGDRVHSHGGFYDKGKILTITRITKTMIICDKQRFKLDNGIDVGGSGWIRTYINPLTKELEDGVRHHNLHTKLSNFNFEKLSLDNLRRIAEIINSSSKTNKEKQNGM